MSAMRPRLRLPSLRAHSSWTAPGKLPPPSLAFPISVVETPSPPPSGNAGARLDVNQPHKLLSTMQSGGEALTDVHRA